MSFRLFRPVQRIAKTSLPSTYRNFHASLPNMVVHNVKSKEEFNDALSKHKVVILDAFATWCGPCKAIAPILANLSNTKEHEGLHFVKIDVDEVPDLSQDLGIRAMPTFLIFKNGEKVEEVVGANPNALTAAVKKYAAEFPPKVTTSEEKAE
ncbi:thioredoxin [Colletotrichum kahawae]|uniref:Thioredoxin n=1 Tax=Colletotrichum kahawae TaxID=34407 RepID=A0AAE0DGN9_COLKA|nr:thioredoxin [Colletotrichum kahawae]